MGIVSIHLELVVASECYWYIPLPWRHNGCAGVSNHHPHHCLLNRLFRRRSKKTPKLRFTGLRAGNSPVTGEFRAQLVIFNAENVSIWRRHHAKRGCAIKDFRPKLFLIFQSFSKFKFCTVLLPCSGQNIKTIGQLKQMLWSNEISRDLSLIKMGFGRISYTAQPQYPTVVIVNRVIVDRVIRRFDCIIWHNYIPTPTPNWPIMG